jgi:hypothetical protein
MERSDAPEKWETKESEHQEKLRWQREEAQVKAEITD